MSEKVPGYADTLEYKNASMLAGKFTMDVTPGDGNLPWESAIIKAFPEDQDLMQIQIVSTCIGFVKTLTKRFKREQAVEAAEEINGEML